MHMIIVLFLFNIRQCIVLNGVVIFTILAFVPHPIDPFI